MRYQSVILNHYSGSTARYNEIDSNILVSMHKHDEIEILMMKKGRLLLNINGNKCVLSDGDIIVIAGNVPHSTLSLDNVCDYIVFISPSILKIENSNNFLGIYGKETFIIINKAHKDYSELHDYIIKLSGCDDDYYYKGYSYFIAGVLNKMGFFDFNKNSNELTEKSVTLVQDIKKYVDEHCYENITIQELSEHFFINSSYLCRTFKKATKYTIKEYVNYKKISIAKDLLLETKKSVAEISCELGFSSSSYFIRVFKQYNIITPIQYREEKPLKYSRLQYKDCI